VDHQKKYSVESNNFWGKKNSINSFEHQRFGGAAGSWVSHQSKEGSWLDGIIRQKQGTDSESAGNEND